MGGSGRVAGARPVPTSPPRPWQAPDKHPVRPAELVPPLSHFSALPRTLPDGEGGVQCLVIFTVNHSDSHSLNSAVASSTAGGGGYGGSPGPSPDTPPLPAVRLPAPFGGADAGLGAPGAAHLPPHHHHLQHLPGRSRGEGPPHPRPSKQREGERNPLVKLPAVGARKINIIRNHCNWDCEI